MVKVGDSSAFSVLFLVSASPGAAEADVDIIYQKKTMLACCFFSRYIHAFFIFPRVCFSKLHSYMLSIKLL